MKCVCGRTFECDSKSKCSSRDNCMCPHCHVKTFSFVGLEKCYPDLNVKEFIQQETIEEL